MSDERIARMNPDAVEEAKVYTGRVHFYDDELVEMEGVPFVEVGKWTAAGEESNEEDFDCTYYAALLLGHKLNMGWLPAGEDGEGRKYLIFKGKDENDRPVPFTMEEASMVAQAINTTLRQARELKQQK